MLSSLFAKKPQNEIGEELSEIIAPPAAVAPSSTPFRLTTDLQTPHDAILSNLYDSETAERIPNDEDKPIRVQTFAGLATLVTPNPTSQVVRDPFDGQTTGTLVLPDPILYPDAHVPLSDAANRNEEIWSHLSTVLDLQGQIAALHLELEGIGKNDHSRGHNRAPNATHRPPVRATSGTVDLLDLEHDEGVGVGGDEDEEQRKDRERDEDFARLADHFEGRKEGVNNIMAKLDGLSKALTEFHALQAPNINLSSSSRHNSIPVTAPASSNPTDRLSASLPPIIPIPYSSNTSVLSPSRMIDSPISVENLDHS